MELMLVVMMIAVLGLACHRSKCNIATIIQSGTPCPSWGIKVGDKTYPVDSILDSFKRQGVLVCVDYELYSDVRTCICCGGARAKIKSIRYPED